MRWQGWKKLVLVRCQFGVFFNCRAKLYCTEMQSTGAGCPGALMLWLVHWCSGFRLLWCSDTLVLWCSGAVVYWCSGALMHWWSDAGSPVHWCSDAGEAGGQAEACWLSPSALFFGLHLLYFAVLACARNSRPWHLTGALMLWYSDALVYWCSDALVHWCAGALKPGGQWQIGK